MDPFGQLGGPQAPMQFPTMGSTAGLNDIASKMQVANQLLANLIQILSNLFPRMTGSFTCAASTSTTVTATGVTSGSFILLMPINAAAGTLIGSNKSLYVTAGSGSFVVTTASGAAAAGTEQFRYIAFSAV